jgi:hypothetical protein
MFQLSFLNAGLLILAAATILPLIIWLLAKKKPPQLVFSSIRFIKRTEKEQKNRTQLKNILLLIIRMLIILLIVLAASRPSLRIPHLKPAKSHPPTTVALVLDTSFSMDYTADGKSTLESAKKAALEINKRLNAQDMTVLVTSDEDWNRLNAQLHAGPLPEKLINSIKSTWLPLTMDKVLESATAKLAGSQFTNREIYLLTDGQVQTLPAKPELPVRLIPLPKPSPWDNLSCSNAEPVMQLTNRQQQQAIRFEVINHGSSVRRDVLVRIDFNGVKAAEKFVTLQPHQKLTETLPVQVMSSGWQNGYVEVLDEKLTADNRSWFTFPFDLHPGIGVITQRTSLPLIMQSVLSVYATPQGSVKLINPQQVNWQQLKDYSVLVMYDAGDLSPRLREFLQTCNKARKGVLICADANLSAGWKGYLQQTFGVQLSQFSQAALPITYVNQYHPVTSLLDQKQLVRTSVSDCWISRVTGSANILLASDKSQLALASDNSLLWLFDPASLQNRFFLEAAFPVFAYRCLQYLSNRQFEAEQLIVGQQLAADELVLPGGDKTVLSGSSTRTLEPGIYTLNWTGSNSQSVAIQPDARESIFKPLVLPSKGNYQILGTKWQQQLFLSRLGHDIWKYLLLAVLALLIFEFVLVKSEEWKPGNKT